MRSAEWSNQFLCSELMTYGIYIENIVEVRDIHIYIIWVEIVAILSRSQSIKIYSVT